MKMLRRLQSWLRNTLHRARAEREMHSELHFHVEARAEDLIRSGVQREEALRRARFEFGGIEQAKEQCREERGLALVQSLQQDVQLAVRMLRKNPAFSLLTVLTLALGIGANSAIFSVVDAMLLRPLPYPEPNQLVRLWESYPSRGFFRNVVNPFNFLDWRDNSKFFASMAAIVGSSNNLNVNGQPIAVPSLRVSPEFFSILGIPPALGRAFVPEDGIAGRERVVILSYELWQSQYAGSPAALDRKIEIDGVSYAIVGVMPRGFYFPKTKAQIWTPLPLARTDDWSSGRYLTTVARLKPGATLEQARQDIARVASLSAEARPDFDKGWSAEVYPLLDDVTQNVSRPLWVLLAAVAFLLLIACANVANLLLMRGAGRLREMAVRSALGASRFRLIRQLLVECFLLAFAGMAVGIIIAQLGLHSLLALIPAGAPLPRSEPITIDARVFLFAFLAALMTAVVFGIVPALRLSRVDLQDALKQGTSRGGVGGHQTLRRCFVIAEIALALLLSVGAGLMVRSFSRLISVDPGFQPEHLLTMHIAVAPTRYEKDIHRSAYFDRLLAEIRTIPGVHAAATTHFLPLTEMTSGSCFAPADAAKPTPAESPSSEFLIVSSNYFAAMGTPILQGRDFEPRDAYDAPPVALVNHAFVDRYYPGQNPLVKQLWVCWDIDKPVQIIGVVADARQQDLQAAPQPTIFLSNTQAPMYFATLVLRTQGDPTQVARSAEEAIHRVDPDQAVSDVQTMEAVFSDSVASPRFETILLGVFAALAIALAVIGIYGVVSYSVTQRTNEIGIRVALGAHSSDIAQLVLREAFGLAAVALFLGFAVSLALSRVLESLLFEIKPSDPFALITAGGLILAVSVIAALLPARRASRVDPIIALRYE